ncbi:MAG: alpha/beta hydrolase [Bacteroides sp.]|nr:alpha/beta hydrolase [Bacteroides sp.]
MKLVTILTVLCLSLNLSAQQKYIEIPLWPDGAPNSSGLSEADEKASPDWIDQVATATLYVYKAGKPNGVAILMCPGGGYRGVAIDHEGHDMAAWLNAQGITYAVLKYRMPNGHREVPLSDAEQAMRIIRSHAGEWGVDPQRVGVMGASAGGHLAASLATLYSSDETRPDFQILFYPVISMVPGITHQGSHDYLLGRDATKELEKQYTLQNRVDERTPQAFLMLSADDRTVPAVNSMDYCRALIEHKVPAALHVYPTGGHGWGFRDNFPYKRQWTEELEKWLRERIIK